MRVPKVKSFDTNSPFEVVELEPMDYNSKWYNFSNQRDKTKWINTCERVIRSSLEYKELILMFKSSRGMNHCAFFKNLSWEAYPRAKIRIEIHHEPFTLYSLIAVVLNDWLMRDQQPDMFQIAEEVMELHYRGLVGLIPLSKTVHQAVHSGKGFIPLHVIDERWNKFVDEYSTSLEQLPEIVDLIRAKLHLTKEYKQDPEQFKSIFRKKYIYVINSDYESIPDELT
jgi:hypothetical protein